MLYLWPSYRICVCYQKEVSPNWLHVVGVSLCGSTDNVRRHTCILLEQL
jgi:hypothetical protein